MIGRQWAVYAIQAVLGVPLHVTFTFTKTTALLHENHYNTWKCLPVKWTIRFMVFWQNSTKNVGSKDPLTVARVLFVTNSRCQILSCCKDTTRNKTVSNWQFNLVCIKNWCQVWSRTWKQSVGKLIEANLFPYQNQCNFSSKKEKLQTGGTL